MAVQRMELASGGWYHGSPSDSLVLDKRMLFITQDKSVAVAYAQGKVAFTGRVTPTQPTVYTLKLTRKKFLDLRKPDHCLIYTEQQRAYNATQVDADNRIPSLKSQGFIMSGTGLPGYGYARAFRVVFGSLFDGMYFDEGSQGISLGLFNPQRSAQILSKEFV